MSRTDVFMLALSAELVVASCALLIWNALSKIHRSLEEMLITRR